MSPDEPEPLPPQSDRILSYHSPQPPQPQPRARSSDGAAAGGCLLSLIFIVGGVFLVLVEVVVNSRSDWVGFSAAGLVFAAPAALGVGMRKSRRWGSFAAGLLTGVGVAGLIAGICFASMWLR